MSRKQIIICAILGVALLAICCIDFSSFISVPDKNSNQVCFSKECFNVEVVQKEEDVRRGLQFRESLALNAGMLFIFDDNRRHFFWMKDTLIPLDMIWLNYGHEVVYIAANVAPCKSDPCPSYGPQEDALYVLEINAGYAEKKGIKLGDRAEFKLK